MNSTLNNQTMSKSMNGLNTINADEVYTDAFETEELDTSTLNVTGTATFLTAPNMSGANITTNTIPLTSINGNANLCKLNQTNYFNFPSGDILRTNTSSSANFYISGADSSIGSNRVGTGVDYFWKMTQQGVLSLKSQTNSFKSWFINENGNIRYYNLGGVDSIKLWGDTGQIDCRKEFITEVASSTLSNIFQANRNYTGAGGGTGHVAINNNGELIFNDGTANKLTLIHSGAISSPNWSITAGGSATFSSINLTGGASFPTLAGNNTFTGQNEFDGLTILANTEIQGSLRNTNVKTYDATTVYLTASDSGGCINLDYTVSNVVLPALTSGTAGFIFLLDTNPTGGDVVFSNPDSRTFLPYGTTTITLAQGETVYIRSSNYNWVVNGDEVRLGNINQTIKGVKTFNKFPVCSSADTITDYNLVNKAYCDDTYATISGHLTTLMDLSTNQTASGIKIFDTSLQFTNQFVCNNQPITLRNSTDVNNRIGFVGAYTTPNYTNVDGVLIEGFEGGVLGTKNSSTQVPYMQWKEGKVLMYKTLYVQDKALFQTTSGSDIKLLQINQNIGGTGNFFVSNNGGVAFVNSSGVGMWSILPTGNAEFSGNVNISGDTDVNILNINTELQLKSGAVWTNNGGSIMDNVGTMYNNAFTTISATGSIPITYSGSKLNISATSPITLSLPATSGNAGVYYWITGDDTYTTTIQVGAGSGDTIYNGSTSVSSFTLDANQTIFIQVCNVGGGNTWVYDVYGSGANLIGSNNVWTGTNAFNTSLPTSTLTPSSSTQLITKGYADGQFVALTGDQNITTGQKRFYKTTMIGCESATGLLTKIGYNSGAYLTDGTKPNIIIGANVLKNNTAGMPLLTQCVAVGNYALENYSPTTAKDQLTAIGTYALRALVADGQNTAVGTYAGMGLQYGVNNAFFGNGSALGLVGTAGNSCNRNFLMGGQAMSGDGRAPIGQTVYAGATQTSNTIVFTNPIANIYAGAQILFYSAASGGGTNVQNLITSYDNATYTVVMNNSSTIIQNSLVFIFTTGSQVDTNVYPGATATGTTFTLQNNSTLIVAGNRCVYYETATLQKYVAVTSWNNTTKVLVVASSITLFGGSTLVFRNTATTTQDRGNGYNDNCVVGNYSLANSATGCSRNVAIGSTALNGLAPNGYDGKTYIWGTENVAIGYACGSYSRHGTSRCIFIGANAQNNGSLLSPYREIIEACAFGYYTNTWADYMYVFGGTNNFIYYPTNYKVCFGVTPSINSVRENYAETGARGVLQIVCGSQDVAQNAISCKAYNDTYYIINFQNSAGVARGQIAGVNSTSVAYNTSSDERLKDEIDDMPSQLENIQKLKPRKFKWKSSGEDDNGFIAQEYYSVYPERTNHKDLYPEEMLGMDYGRCTPYLWKGVSELIDIVKKQQEEINLLKEILSRNNIK